jgi:enoyl-CoA hydratase/carnithine racemase
MDFSTVLYEEKDGVAWITLNRPGALNAFDSVMIGEVESLWRLLREKDDIRAIVLTGAGDKAFCSGLDRSEIPADQSEYFFNPYTYEDPGRSLGPKTQGLWKPVIAAVNGIACGGAFYLLGESDVIIAAERATFFDPHVTYGLPAVYEPGLMLSRMPFGDTLRMALMGVHERITAGRAREIGLVTEVVPATELSRAAGHVAGTIASQPAPAVQATLRAMWAARELSPRQFADLGNVLLSLGLSPELLEAGHDRFRARQRGS